MIRLSPDGVPGIALGGELSVTETDEGWLFLTPADVDFAAGTVDLDPAAQAELDKVAALIADYEPQAIRIEGHTDSEGAVDRNQNLSELRAQQVEQHLVSRHNIDDAIIEARGFGESRPIASNLTVEGREANRRDRNLLQTLGPKVARAGSCERCQTPVPIASAANGFQFQLLPVPIASGANCFRCQLFPAPIVSSAGAALKGSRIGHQNLQLMVAVFGAEKT